MWTTESLWFEIALVSIVYALGNILMGGTNTQDKKGREVLLDADYYLWYFSSVWPDSSFDLSFRPDLSDDLHSWLLLTEEEGH